LKALSPKFPIYLASIEKAQFKYVSTSCVNLLLLLFFIIVIVTVVVHLVNDRKKYL